MFELQLMIWISNKLQRKVPCSSWKIWKVFNFIFSDYLALNISVSFCSWQVDSHFIWCVWMFFNSLINLYKQSTVSHWFNLITCKLVASLDLLFYMWLQCYGLMNFKAYGVLDLFFSPRFKSPEWLGDILLWVGVRCRLWFVCCVSSINILFSRTWLFITPPIDGQ